MDLVGMRGKREGEWREKKKKERRKEREKMGKRKDNKG